jgi:hypothetical protein
MVKELMEKVKDIPMSIFFPTILAKILNMWQILMLKTIFLEI